ncbi:unnamed protein product [Larinioides sclopetarius]|uniref:Uncharacterized protein n=1 Tax=Larinioides sclopetarius TaxID=280406 RepID=A0AAV2BYN3_9ARAC
MNFFTLTFRALGRNHIASKTGHRPSQCFVLIRQSDSLSPCQFCMVFSSLNSKSDSFNVAQTELPKFLPEYLIIHGTDDKLKNVAFSDTKTQGAVGSVTSIKKLKSGDLLVESSTMKQSEQPMALTNFADVPIAVSGHKTLNYTRGVISSEHLMVVSEEEFVTELQSIRVASARRITLKREEKGDKYDGFGENDLKHGEGKYNINENGLEFTGLWINNDFCCGVLEVENPAARGPMKFEIPKWTLRNAQEVIDNAKKYYIEKSAVNAQN